MQQHAKLRPLTQQTHNNWGHYTVNNELTTKNESTGWRRTISSSQFTWSRPGSDVQRLFQRLSRSLMSIVVCWLLVQGQAGSRPCGSRTCASRTRASRTCASRIVLEPHVLVAHILEWWNQYMPHKVFLVIFYTNKYTFDMLWLLQYTTSALTNIRMTDHCSISTIFPINTACSVIHNCLHTCTDMVRTGLCRNCGLPSLEVLCNSCRLYRRCGRCYNLIICSQILILTYVLLVKIEIKIM